MKHATGWKDNNPGDGADAASLLDSEGAQRGSTRMNTANLRKLLDEATPRPWVHEDGSYWIRDPAQPEYIGLVECHDSAMNAALIVELVNSADELLAENERLRAALIFIRDKEQAALNEAERLRLNIPEDAGCMEILHAARNTLEQKT